MPVVEPPPARLLEQITAQQAHVAVLDERLQAAERAITRAGSPAAGATAHHRADQALLALEAAEQALGELIAAHTAAARPGAAPRRRLRAVPSAGQDALFDVG